MLCVVGLLTAPAQAQVPFPPPAAALATSPQAALAALSVGVAEASTYVMLEVPEVAAPGKIKARIGSEYPGTTMLLLLRTIPETAPDQANAKSLPKPPTPLMPSLIVARKVAPGQRALVEVELEITRTQRFAVYVLAQGRWFVADREVKVGRDADSHR